MTVADTTELVCERPLWRRVAVPSEHGGWGLTLEPVLLGLMIAPSLVGAVVGLGAFIAFFVRSPLKLVVIDVRRKRWLDRSKLAMRFAIGELVVLAGIAVAALWVAGRSWLVPVVIALPLVGVEFWFDIRSRGRRLIPELCGAIGISSVVAVIVLASGNRTSLAVGAWLVLSARAVGSIPFVRVQISRLRRTSMNARSSDAAQTIAIGIGVAAVLTERKMMLGLLGLMTLAVLQLVWVRRTPLVPKVLGMCQMALGIALVAVTAVGVLLI